MLGLPGPVSASNAAPDKGRVSAECNGDAEEVLHCTVAGRQFGLLRPGRAIAHEDIGCARADVGSTRSYISIAVGPNECRVPAECNELPELVPHRSVTGDEFGLLGPGRTAAGEDINRAALDDRVAAEIGRNEGGVPFERDGVTE